MTISTFPTSLARSSAPDVVAAKGVRTITACIPARDESATIASVLAVCGWLRDAGVLDDLIVVDDHSVDDTAILARRMGATVVTNEGDPGKGQALRTAVAAAGEAEVLVFLDADVRNFSDRFVSDLVLPLLTEPAVQLVKPAYRRPLDGRAGEGGRVTELLARPLLERWFPELATLDQPLAGECAMRRSALEGMELAGGYRIEIGLLIDVYLRFGRAAITEVDLGERVHRNRPLAGLRPHTRAVLDAVMARAGR